MVYFSSVGKGGTALKQLGPLRLAFVFAGCFLGAGYVSGQELWQFFGCYGASAVPGLLIAVALLALFGIVILRLAVLTGEREVDRVVVPWEAPPLRVAVGILEALYLFGIAAIMCSGAGSLAEEMLALPHWLGSLLFSLLLLVSAFFGMRGVVSVFSVSVPLLAAAAVAFGVFSLSRYGLPAEDTATTGAVSPLLGGWVSGALTFACYNVFGTIGILTPFGAALRGRCTVFLGVIVGAVGLLLIAAGVLISVACVPGAEKTELPMLSIAAGYGAGCAWLYALLLLAAMFGTAVSSFVGLVDYLRSKFPVIHLRRRLFTPLFTLGVYLAGLFGFGDLIGVLFPIFGYASAVFLVTMLVHYMILRRKNAG